MKLEKYTVASHTCGAFTKESELNPESLRQYNITKNRMDILTKEIISRISNLYNINQFDANKTLNDLMQELREICDYEQSIFK